MEIRWPIVAGRSRFTDSVQVVQSPFSGEPVAKTGQAGTQDVEDALVHAYVSRQRVRQTPTHQRRSVLLRMAAGLESAPERFVEAIIAEAGKPRGAAAVEVERAAEVFRLAAGELARFGGAVVPVDLLAAGNGTTAEVRQTPAGVVVGIVPFNFPLNLGAHKVAPALAVGAPIIVKPPPQAPGAQLLLAELALACGADSAALQVVPCATPEAERLATDSRVAVVSFTGSAKVGWHLRRLCPGRVVLELGGNAAAYVAADADVSLAAQRLAISAFSYAGQVCIKVQRIIVHRTVAQAFTDAFVVASRRLEVGDPAQSATQVGPVIDQISAERIHRWVADAVHGGASLLLDGPHQGQLLWPRVVVKVPSTSQLYREEVFGPVVCLETANSDDEAVERVNDSDYGLQAGLFTNSLSLVRTCFAAFEVGGLVVNDAPSFRSDNMPYGGVKGSGQGREGVRYAMADYCESKILVTRPQI